MRTGTLTLPGVGLDLDTVRAQRPRVCFELVPGATLGSAVKDAFGYLWTALYTSTCCPVGGTCGRRVCTCVTGHTAIPALTMGAHNSQAGCVLVKERVRDGLPAADRIAHAQLLTAGAGVTRSESGAVCGLGWLWTPAGAAAVQRCSTVGIVG